MDENLGLRHRVDPDGILRIVFDLPDSKVNLLNETVLRELDRLLEEVRPREEVVGLLFREACWPTQ